MHLDSLSQYKEKTQSRSVRSTFTVFAMASDITVEHHHETSVINSCQFHVTSRKNRYSNNDNEWCTVTLEYLYIFLNQSLMLSHHLDPPACLHHNKTELWFSASKSGSETAQPIQRDRGAALCYQCFPCMFGSFNNTTGWNKAVCPCVWWEHLRSWKISQTLVSVCCCLQSWGYREEHRHSVATL